MTRGLTPEALYLFYSMLTDPGVPSVLWKGHWSSDPDDDAFLATAFAFGAQLWVSRDRDLLNLKHFYECQIVTPVRALPLCRQAIFSRPSDMQATVIRLFGNLAEQLVTVERAR